MKALTYFIHLAEKIRSLENPTSRNFKHARVVPSFFENLKKITLETVRIALKKNLTIKPLTCESPAVHGFHIPA